MADSILTGAESDCSISARDKTRMRTEINKAMSFTLNDKAAEHGVQRTGGESPVSDDLPFGGWEPNEADLPAPTRR